MKLGEYKKIILLGVILLIVAGAVVVALKGVNVSLQLHQHDSIVLKLEKKIELNDISEICSSIFKNKKYIVKEVEMFEDSVNIVVESITDEEKSELVKKINEKYGTELEEQNLIINTNSNIRIRDIGMPFALPVIITIIVIGIIYAIIYRSKAEIIKYVKSLGVTAILEALIASIIAIARIPFSQSIITLMLIIGIIQIMVYMNKK